MEPTWDIPDKMLDNEQAFTQDFFRRFDLRRAAQPIELTPGVKKDYLFPTFYGDVTCAMAIFPCPYARAQALVAERLSPQASPVRMPGSRALVAFSCYQYKRVMHVRPYNEIAVAIPVMVKARLNPPLLPLVMPGMFDRLGYFIADMPVTSEENRLRGNVIWGLPKTTRPIQVTLDDTDCISEVLDEQRSTYLKVRVPLKGRRQHFDESSFLYSRHAGRVIRSRTCFTADFRVSVNPRVLFSSGESAERPYLEIGTSPDVAHLRDLEIEAVPFQLRYAEHMNACFDLRDPLPPAWLQGLAGG